MHRPALGLLCATALVAACESTPLSRTDAPIVDGVRETGEPAVVLIQAVIGACTGTLITDRVVLTAKHCVQLQTATSPAPPSFFSVGIGDRVGATTNHRVVQVLTTPGRFFIGDGTDIALLVLRDPVTGVEPISVRREPATELVGSTVTAIGFGTTREREVGVKYRTTATIENVSSTVLEGRNTICQGDSGGPIILEAEGDRPRQVVGVASYGQVMREGDCPAFLDAWNRVDTYLDLIDAAIVRSGGCVATGEERCNSIDDDCDGELDEGCLAIGETCERDDQCAFGPLPEALREGAPPSAVCAEIGGARRCTRPCDPLAPRASCAEIAAPFGGRDPIALDGFYCDSTAGCEGLCAPGTAGAGSEGAACSADTECVSLRCEGGVCATPCRGDSVACPAVEVCGADAGSCGVCVAPSARPTRRGRGEVCGAPSECSTFGCGEVDGVDQCTAICVGDGDCGTGMRCVGGYCARGARGAPFGTCREDAECNDARCLARPTGERFCARLCSSATCSGGTCVDVDGESRCIPNAPVLGEACDDGVACAQGECIAGACTARCGGDRSCPVGHDCVREGDATLCRPRPRSSGGCSVTAGTKTGGTTALAAFATLALAITRRASRRRPRRRPPVPQDR